MALALEPEPVDFNELFRDHAPGLLRLIRSRIGDAGVAEDVLQETFVRFFRFYVLSGRLDPSRPVGPLLAVIARREAARRGRALGRQRELDAAAWPAAVSDAVGSDEHVAALYEEPIVRAALRGLDPRQRRLLLQWEARRSTKSLAMTEQLTVPVLKQVVVRARRNFRERYQAACGKAGGLAPVVVPWFAQVVVRLRSRLRLDATRHDVFTAGVGLAACSVALIGITGGAGVVQSRAAVPASHQWVAALVAPDMAPAPDTAFDVGPQSRGSRSASPSPVGTSAPDVVVHTAPVTGARVAGNGAVVHVVEDDPQGNSRSIRELTVQCDAGTTARLTCTILDLAPSGSGDL